jgi:hypothetical protein
MYEFGGFSPAAAPQSGTQGNATNRITRTISNKQRALRRLRKGDLGQT